MKAKIVFCLMFGMLAAYAPQAQASVAAVATASRSFRLDTRSVHEVDGSAVVNIAYSGNLWGAAGSGASADLAVQWKDSATRTLSSGLSSDGVFGWSATANGMYTVYISSGSITWQERLHVSRIGLTLIVY